MLSWKTRARPKQLEPEDDWQFWVIQTGRGWGKNACGSNTVIEKVKSGEARNIALIAPTAADARDYMVDESGENSGILSNSSPDFYPRYWPTKRRLVWPNGAVATTFSAEDPDQLRGPNIDFAWCDELASWQAGKREQVWSNLMFTLRRGKGQVIVTTTPRPILLLKEIKKLPRCVLTTGATHENIHNLSDNYINTIIKPYEGTRLGRQELEGEFLEENDLALFDMATIDRNRILDSDRPDLDIIVVSVDPTGSKTGHGCGIVIGGRSEDKGYVIGDYSKERTAPNDWAKAAVDAYDDFEANYIVVEINFGGDMVANTIRMYCQSIDHPPIPIKEVHASRGKALRAEPISSLAQQNRIKFVGSFGSLEDQLYALESGEADDRADAFVWVMTDLIANKLRRVRPYAGDSKSRSNRPAYTVMGGNSWSKVF